MQCTNPTAALSPSRSPSFRYIRPVHLAHVIDHLVFRRKAIATFSLAKFPLTVEKYPGVRAANVTLEIGLAGRNVGTIWEQAVVARAEEVSLAGVMRLRWIDMHTLFEYIDELEVPGGRSPIYSRDRQNEPHLHQSLVSSNSPHPVSSHDWKQGPSPRGSLAHHGRSGLPLVLECGRTGFGVRSGLPSAHFHGQWYISDPHLSLVRHDSKRMRLVLEAGKACSMLRYMHLSVHSRDQRMEPRSHLSLAHRDQRRHHARLGPYPRLPVPGDLLSALDSAAGMKLIQYQTQDSVVWSKTAETVETDLADPATHPGGAAIYLGGRLQKHPAARYILYRLLR